MSIFRFSVLSENLARKQPFRAEHGLSLLIESDSRVILFDTGGSDTFFFNSRAMDIELFGVDDIILSHGHYDHTSGLVKAVKEAPCSVVHLHERAFDKKLSSSTGRLRYIGIPEKTLAAVRDLETRERLAVMTGTINQLDFAFKLFSTGGREDLPDNWPFYIDIGKKKAVPDRFEDEISLLIEGDNSCCLVTGCSHCGIDNIYSKALELTEKPVAYVMGGSHLDGVDDLEVKRVADFFAPLDVKLFLGHCTGIYGFSRLYKYLGKSLDPMFCGMRLELEL